MTNLADIAAALREHSPGVLPESLTEDGMYGLCIAGTNACRGRDGDYGPASLPDDITAAVLRDAMVRDAAITWNVAHKAWEAIWYDEATEIQFEAFRSHDHGGSLGACYQAWRWSKGLPAA